MRKTLTKMGVIVCACFLSLSMPEASAIAVEGANEQEAAELLIGSQTTGGEQVPEETVIEEHTNATLTKKGKLLLNNLYYAIESDGDGNSYAVLTGVKKQKSSFTVPEKIYYEDVPYTVLKIGLEAFAGCSLKTIELPDCIELIDDMAFAGAADLKSIKIPKQCERIGVAAFMGCEKLSKVDFNDAYCHIIDDAAFSMSGVKTVKLSIITDSIGAACFYGCPNLKSITFGANCDYVGEGAFTDCPSLETFKKVKMNKYLVIENGCIYSKNAKKLYSAALAAGDVIIKDTVEEILPYSFENNSKITTVIVPGSVKEIPEGCFVNCENLENVIILNGVEVIGESSFYNCSKLANISIPKSINSILDNPFLLCKKLAAFSVNSENKNYKVNGGMLMDKASSYIIAAPAVTGTVKLPSGCKGVAEYAFAFNTKIKKLTVNSKCKYFGEGAFYGCSKLSYVYMPNRKVDMSVSEINEAGEFCGVFGGCAKSIEVNLPYSSEAGSKNSIEINLKRHCDKEMIITQH